MEFLERMGTALLFLLGGVGFTAAVPMLLRRWRERRRWTRVRVTVVEVTADGALVVEVPAPGGARRVTVARFGEGEAGPGDTIELHHPPGRPERATHGSAFGYLAAAGFAALLALACWGLLLRGA